MRLRFAAPEAADLPGRLDAVLEAVFAACGAGWDRLGGPDRKRRDLAGEAVFLERMVAEVMPDELEPLPEQDAVLWVGRAIAEADAALAQAGAMAQFGRLQCVAAIQAVHAARITGRIDVEALDLLYEALAQFSPTPGVLAAQAAVRASAQGPAAGLAQPREAAAMRRVSRHRKSAGEAQANRSGFRDFASVGSRRLDYSW